MNIKATIVTFLSVFAILILTGCNLIPEEPNIILEDQVCSPPCWNGITPGRTTVDGAMQILEKSTDLGVMNIFPNYKTIDGYELTSWTYQDEWDGFLLTQNNLVVLIKFASQKRLLNIMFSQAIEKFGEPETVFSSFNPDIPDWGSLAFITPEHGIIYTYASHVEKKRYQLTLRPETPIDTITYFEPNDYEKIIGFLIPEIDKWSKEEYEASLYPWRGYGSIAEKYPTGYGKK